VRSIVAIGSIAVCGALLLVVSLIAQPFMPPTRLPRLAPVRDFGNADPSLTDHNLHNRSVRVVKAAPVESSIGDKAFRKLDRTQNKEIQTLRGLNAGREARRNARSLKAEQFLAKPRVVNPSTIVAGFYVNWEQSANVSLRNNVKSLTHLMPEWLHLKPAGTNYTNAASGGIPFVDARQKLDITEVTPRSRSNGVSIIPLINNYTSTKGAEEGAGDWDSAAVHQIVSNPRARANVIQNLSDWLIREKMQGINIDFEEVPAADRGNLVQFMKELYAALNPKGLLVTQDVQLDVDGQNVPALAQWCDWIVPMFYDQHSGGDPPGPIAGVDWTRKQLDKLLQSVPASKVVMGVGNQAYDWLVGDSKNGAESIDYQQAMTLAKETAPESVVRIDPTALNPMFTYTTSPGDTDNGTKQEKHEVWMLDAVSVYNQLTIAKPRGIRGGALWFVGAEDPSLWSFFDKNKWHDNWLPIVRSGALDSISYGGQGLVEFQGDGELLMPTTGPAIGMRTVHLESRSGLITGESYTNDPATNVPKYPEGWVVRRYGGGGEGNPAKQIVLTFDDGPDPDWTPRILDILKANHTPAVFFVVGKMAEEHPDLLRRMWDEGHEIGNHSWDHPELFKLSAEHQRLELTTTERVIQAITGHSTTLFRPPYGGDVEPTTGREVSPMLMAADMHYMTVGEKNDPQDYRLFEYQPGSDSELDSSRPRRFESIVQSVVDNRDTGSIVLLHDAGGPRANTVAALPLIIHKLRALGYTFVSVADLRYPAQTGKVSRAQMRNELMPKITGRDEVLVGSDRYVFEVSYAVQRTLSTLFVLSLILGVSRVAIFVILAIVQKYREARRVLPIGYAPFISVVIAAFNEELVINRTIQTILSCDYQNLEVVVVDDGSKDRTYEVVKEEFGNDPRVTALRKVNGGKASALNFGLAIARGEIFVSLDADTLFASDTINKLVRHFKNTEVGAVSGNVRVGNVRNLWTRWQALEYITSQNFDRRAYDLLNCITVVPGAVGALRRDAVMSVGGYTHDTLAEDTDLTWKMRRAGWRIVNDSTAMAYTEAPETLRSLAKQRFRWAFGTLQCLWKHRAAMFQHGAFGWLAIPSLWLYQILFPAISPFMDIYLLYSIVNGNLARVGVFYLGMFGIELLAASVATAMDSSGGRLLPWLFFQKFLYRQLMYYVILKSIFSAFRGGAVGWGKLERTGSARVEGSA
jgi:cellulose synthase/poly-beta-1,6-N-acetylglucosamine synthase-like glycosyltransferase/peptidoglycan/xylan/chitin deacetylase (PgdA/CDA1 family)/spore germination protein YaaH